MKSVILFFFSLVVFATIDDIRFVDEVCILTKDNFDKAINEFPFTLVNFYTHTSTIRQALFYIQAAQRLAKSHPEIKLCRVDWQDGARFYKRFIMKNYNTIFYFEKGNFTPIELSEAIYLQMLLKWVGKRSLGLLSEIKSVEEANRIISENNIVTLFLGSSSSEDFEVYKKTVEQKEKQYEDIVFLYSDSEELRQKYKAGENSIVMVTGNGDNSVLYNRTFTTEKVSTFIEENRFPLKMEHTLPTAEKISDNTLTALFLFIQNEEEGKTVSEVFRTAVKEFEGKDLGLMFSIVSMEEKLGKRVADHLEIRIVNLPAVRIFHLGEIGRKYVFDRDITVENLRSFIQDYSEKKLKPFLKSEEIPQKPFNGNIRIVVGKNWEEIVMDATKDVIILLYPSYSDSFPLNLDYFKLLAPFIMLPDTFQGSENLVFAEMDPWKNEAESLNLQKTAILFYPRNDKRNPVIFEGEKPTCEELVSFVKQQATVPIVVRDTKTGDPVDDDPIEEDPVDDDLTRRVNIA